MVQKRFSKLHGLLGLVAVLLLMPTGATPQTQPATGKAKVDRLVMSLINPYRDYMRPWINGTPDHNIQHDPAFEWLFEVWSCPGSVDGELLSRSSPRPLRRGYRGSIPGEDCRS